MKESIKFHRIRSIILLFAIGLMIGLFQLVCLNESYSQTKIQFDHLEINHQAFNLLSTYTFQDSRGFIWIGGYSGLYKYDGYELVQFVNIPGDSTSIVDNKVLCIIEDDVGNLWIGCQEGLSIYNRKLDSFKHIAYNEKGQYISRVNCMSSPSNENILISHLKGLTVFNTDSGVMKTYNHDPEDSLSLSSNLIRDIYQDKAGMYWLATPNGLNVFNPSSENFYRYSFQTGNIDDPKNNSILEIEKFDAGQILLSTVGGLNKFNINTKQFNQVFDSKHPLSKLRCGSMLNEQKKVYWIHMYFPSSDLYRVDLEDQSFEKYIAKPDNPRGFQNVNINSIMKDAVNVIWFSTQEGIYTMDPSKQNFRHIASDPRSRITSINQIQQPYEYRPNEILSWKDGELWLLDYRTNTYNLFPYKPKNHLEKWALGTTCYYRDLDSIFWIGTGGAGAFRLDEKTEEFTYFSLNKSWGHRAANTIRDIIDDGKGNIWFAHWAGGVSRYNKETTTVTSYLPIEGDSNSISARATRTFFLDSKQKLWIGTRNGLNIYLPESDSFQQILPDPNNSNSLNNYTVFSIYEDKDGIMWFGTYGGGVNRYNPITEQFSHITKKEGLPDNNVFSIFPDKMGNFWMTTFMGIVRFNPELNQIKIFGKEDGLSNDNYDGFAHFKSPYSGKLIYESFEGYDIFHPDSIVNDPNKPPVVITSMTVFNENVTIGKTENEIRSKKRYYLPQHISEIEKIKLNYKFNVFSFQFSGLNFKKPSQNEYAYFMEGFDHEWQYIGNKRSTTFTNLNPGNYTFHVKASNSDGVWNEQGTTVAITILPPWWRTNWVYLAYFILLASLIYFAFKLLLERKLSIQEAKQLKELDHFKTLFYTNITHEFRTPLTVITGMADQLIEDPKNWLYKGSEMIKRNGEKLLFLVNQMLDLRKLESGNTSLDLIQSDIVAYIKYLVQSFQSYADLKNIDLDIQSQQKSIMMDFDPEKISQIVSNLLSNAIKYSLENTCVQVNIYRTQIKGNAFLKLQTKDEGMGIPEDQIPNIFDRFYQVDDSLTSAEGGSGIGLAIVKELVKLMNGQISIDSHTGSGSTFTVLLPITNTAQIEPSNNFLIKRHNIPDVQTAVSYSFVKENLPVILIIEDNQDVCIYLSSILSKNYSLHFAKDGEIGLEEAFRIIPDLILTDIMMPKKNGYEVCRILKQNIVTSHIPVIMLTAKADIDSRLTGLQQAADAFLSKPFIKEELLMIIQNLLEIRLKLQQRYQSLDLIPTTKKSRLGKEDLFVQEIKHLIEQHLIDENFGIKELCKSAGISRTQLHNKLKALTGRSTAIFIRSVRLTKAKEMIINTDSNISQIAYEVGFKDPNYFSRSFSNEFNISPSELRAQA